MQSIYLLLLFAISNARPALLASKLPFKVISMNPSTKYLHRDTSLTVIFSRPVIALGSDFGTPLQESQNPFHITDDNGVALSFPMKLRYVTTFIARLDLEIGWPPDLSLSWTINPNLQTFDGLDLAEVPSLMHYITSSLDGKIDTVDSPKALSLTDGYWSSKLSTETIHEVPPDGSFTIEFSYPVDTDRVKKDFVLLNGETMQAANNVNLVFDNCSRPVDSCNGYWCSFTSGSNHIIPMSRCLKIMPVGIERNTCYILRLPKGTKYNHYAGLLGQDIDFDFCGLRKFDFPFFTPYSVRFRRYDLYLRHGLSDSVSLNMFQSVLSIQSIQRDQVVGTLPYNISRFNLGTLRISANFLPSATYKFVVLASNDITDGFGQPLQSSQIILTTNAMSDFFIAPQGSQFVVFEKFAAKWKVLSRQSLKSSLDYSLDYSLAITSVNETNILSALGIMYHKETLIDPTFIDTKNVMSSKPDGKFYILEEEEESHNRSLFLRSETIHSSRGHRSCSSALTSITDLGLSALSYEDHIVVWVTSFTTGAPVSGVRIRAYCKSYSCYGKQVESMTDNDGIATLFTDANSFIFAVLESSQFFEDIAIIPNVYGFSRVSDSAFQGTILTDRAIYKPGEKMHIKCYLRARKGFDWYLPSEKDSWELKAIFKPKEIGKEEIAVVLTPIWGKMYGSFDASITIPEGSSYGKKWWYLRMNNGYSYATANFVIADPRRPTARLKISTSSKVYIPSTSLPINIKVETGSGLPIGNAHIALNWEVTTPGHPDPWRWWVYDPPVKTTGVVEIVSGPQGTVSHSFQFPAEAKDSIKVQAVWVGPTGELIEESIELDAALSEWTIKIEASPRDPLPGFPFELLVSVVDQNENIIEGQTVSVKLLGPNKDIKQECDSTSDLQCSHWILPTANKYFIFVSTTDPRGTDISTQLELGKTPDEWHASPLAGFSSLSMQLDRQYYSPSDTAMLSFHNPFNKSRLLLTWGDRIKKNMKQVMLETGQVTIDVPLAQECTKGCNLAAILHVPRIGKDALVMPVPIPISPLFDLHAPRSVFQILPISVITKDVQLGINLQVHAVDSVALPGSETQVSVSLIDQSTSTHLSGEVAVFAVDRAFLDLKPHEIRDLQSDFSIDQADQFHFSSSYQSLAFESGYNASIQTAVRRLGLDPWLPIDLPLIARPGRAIDRNDSAYLSGFSTRITQFPSKKYYTFGPPVYPLGPPVYDYPIESSPEMDSTSVTRSSVPFSGGKERTANDRNGMMVPTSTPAPAAIATQAPLRTDFETAPLFLGSLLVDKAGSSFTFKLPDTIGTFVIRAYAVDSANHFGSNETTLISRRPISTQPTLPRFARVGDVFKCGVTVTADQTTSDSKVKVSAQSDESISLTQTQATVRLIGTNPVPAQMEMKAIAIGDGVLRFTTTLKGNTVDDMEAKISVIGVQNPVYIATSMALTGKAVSEKWIWNERLNLPPSLPGSGLVEIVAGVGRFTTVQTLRDVLLNETFLTSELIISRAALCYPLARYNRNPNLTNWYTQSVQLLQAYSSQTLGLRWITDRHWHWYIQTTPDIALNAYSLHIANLLKKVKSGLDNEMVSWWTEALTSGLIQQVKKERLVGRVWSNFDILAYVYLAMGPKWVPNKSMELSIDRLHTNLDRCSLEGKLALSLAYLVHNVPSDIITLVVDEVISSLRVQGRTAYISSLNQHASARSLGVQALGLSVLALHGEQLSNPLVEKLANYVAQGNANGAGFFYSWRSRDMALAAIALADYDRVKQNTQPNLFLNVKCEDNLLLDAHFDSPSSPIAQTITKYSELSKLELVDNVVHPVPLKLSGYGTGEVSVAFGLRFIPAKILRDPVYRGIFVERVIRRLDPLNGMPTGPNLQLIETGTIVKVTIQLTTPDDLRNVILEDLLPAGLEPLDQSSGDVYPPSWYGLWRNSWFNSRQTRPDRITWEFQYLSAGSHSVSYQAIANTVGTFSLPPSKAAVTTQPELMGLSKGGCFVVSSDVIPYSEHTSYLEAFGCQPQSSVPPQMCTEDCGTQMACNLTSGLCQTVLDESEPDYKISGSGFVGFGLLVYIYAFCIACNCLDF